MGADAMSQHNLLPLAAQLLVGFGAFGADPVTRRALAIDSTVDQLLIFVADSEPQFINIYPVIFYGAGGKEIPRKDICAQIQMSSLYTPKTDAEILDIFLNGGMLHSAREIAPSLVIKLKNPTYISRIEIPNRGDAYHIRSRALMVKAFCHSRCVFDYDNMSSTRLLQNARDLLTFLEMSFPAELSESDQHILGNDIDAKIIASLEKGDSYWTVGRIIEILPIYEVEEDLSLRAEMGCARILLNLLENNKIIQTSNLRILELVLNTDAKIEMVRRRATALATVQGQKSQDIVISKHHVHYSNLIEKRPVYLNALAQAFDIMKNFNAQAFLCYGTLLGAVREGDFLAHDDDVDLLYFDGASSYEEAKKKKEELIHKFKENGYSVWDTGENFNVSICGAEIDLFFSWLSEGRLHLMMEKFQFRSIDARLVLPASTVKLCERYFPAPANPQGFLQERYGEGWRKPDPYYEWPWPVSRKLA